MKTFCNLAQAALQSAFTNISMIVRVSKICFILTIMLLTLQNKLHNNQWFKSAHSARSLSEECCKQLHTSNC